MTEFFAVLSVIAGIGAVAGSIGLVSPARKTVTGLIGPQALWLGGLVALTATLGSLWLSEVEGFAPCALCWYQRIAMYPLALILLIAAFRGDLGIRRYVLPLASIGAVIASYHLVLQRFPELHGPTCDPSVPCTAVWVQHFGFVSIPFMALTGFLAIIVLMIAAAMYAKE